MNIKDLFELVFGTALFFLSLVGCVIISNKITQAFTSNSSRNINLLLLIIHLIIIVAFIIALRSFFLKYFKNKKVLNGIFSLTGPIVGLSSIYMSDTLHGLIGLI
jgi:hypothetical protein